MFGTLTLNKPAGLSSRDAVNRVQRICRPVKVGHAGTLDPMASGVLLICLGPATKLVPYYHQLPKCYRASFLFGRRSPTDDTDGPVEVLDNPPIPSPEHLAAVLAGLQGTIEQVPPQVSAVKIKGERAYEIARRGEVAAIQPKTVQIHQITVLGYDYPRLELEMICGTGTYVRALGRDAAALLGTSAVMDSLVRTWIGGFQLGNALALDDLTAETLTRSLRPPQWGLEHVQRLENLPTQVITRLRHGQRVPIDHCPPQPMPPGEEFLVIDGDSNLNCIVRVDGDVLVPKTVFPVDGA